MSGSILTPAAIWSEFKIDTIPEAEIIEEQKDGELIISRIYISGKRTAKGQVKIFATLTRGVQLSLAPAIIIFKDFDDYDFSLDKEIAKRGYAVLSVDLAGKRKERDGFFTVYPEDLAYAEYDNAKDSLFHVEKDVTETCWYEWAVIARYALCYLKNQPYVTKVGGIGVAEAATVLWQLSVDKDLSAAAFVLNAGWSAYKGLFKFEGKADPQFSDEMIKFIAGVEPQSYAAHINCPVLVSAATNSPDFDVDRVTDTLTRVKKNLFVAVDYSVGRTYSINIDSFRNVIEFFNEFLMRDSINDSRKNPEIRAEFALGAVRAEVIPGDDEEKEVTLYASEGVYNPSLRSWSKITRFERNGGKYEFVYTPYSDSGVAFFFARVSYKGGYALCTNVAAVKFGLGEGGGRYKSGIVYSGREENAESVFSAIPDLQNKSRIDISGKSCVQVMSGPMDITGICADTGLRTFKINAEKDKPSDQSMLMLDLFVKDDQTFTVRLISDYFGKTRAEYIARVNVKGGNVWHNIRLNMSAFKTGEGMPLKSYAKINAMEFYCPGEYLVNNILWV